MALWRESCLLISPFMAAEVVDLLLLFMLTHKCVGRRSSVLTSAHWTSWLFVPLSQDNKQKSEAAAEQGISLSLSLYLCSHNVISRQRFSFLHRLTEQCTSFFYTHPLPHGLQACSMLQHIYSHLTLNPALGKVWYFPELSRRLWPPDYWLLPDLWRFTAVSDTRMLAADPLSVRSCEVGPLGWNLKCSLVCPFSRYDTLMCLLE